MDDEIFMDEDQPVFDRDYKEMTGIAYYIHYERKRIYLINEEFEYDFSIEVFAEGNKGKIKEGIEVRDVIEIYALNDIVYKDSGDFRKYDNFTASRILSDVIDTRSWGSQKYLPISGHRFEEWNINNKKFYNVQNTTGGDHGPWEVFFNYEFGLISFIDSQDNRWWFERFE